MTGDLGILRFHEQYFERIWGGQRLRTLFGKPIPADRPVGEAWLVSDHPSAVSVVSHGPHAERTLHDLIVENPVALLGPRAKLTPHGRFPLLLKLLDSTDVLSVQVHPDDATAAAMGEPDVGKTEMWHILDADPGAELFCGFRHRVTADQVRTAIETGTLEEHLACFNVKQGDSIYVPAGTVHAIGGGIVLAEIQQNSDLTYRLYDWNRTDARGEKRELHIEKGLRSLCVESFAESKLNIIHEKVGIGGNPEVVWDEKYFSLQRLNVESKHGLDESDAFSIVLCVHGSVVVSDETIESNLETGSCCLIPASSKNCRIDGKGIVLIFSV